MSNFNAKIARRQCLHACSWSREAGVDHDGHGADSRQRLDAHRRRRRSRKARFDWWTARRIRVRGRCLGRAMRIASPSCSACPPIACRNFPGVTQQGREARVAQPGHRAAHDSRPARTPAGTRSRRRQLERLDGAAAAGASRRRGVTDFIPPHAVGLGQGPAVMRPGPHPGLAREMLRAVRVEPAQEVRAHRSSLRALARRRAARHTDPRQGNARRGRLRRAGGDQATIVLNRTAPATRKRFTLAHELGHIMLMREESGA